MLQILALDIGTDLLPALALGAEPPAAHILERPPERGRLISRDILARVFGVLGPAEAIVEMLAFTTVLLLGGWRLGDDLSSGPLLAAASGAAFTAVVIGQMANAFACRSTVQPVRRMTWRTNRLLVGAVVAEVATLLVFLLPPLSGLLEHRLPTLAGGAVALLAVPAVLTADTLNKHRIRRRREASH